MAFLTIAIAILATTSSVAAQSATRTLPGSVTPGETFEVGIVATGYSISGQVIETLPAGFDYVSSSLSPTAVAQVGQTVTFTFFAGEGSFTYNVTASSIEGTYTFSGILKDFDKNEYVVGGDTGIAVTSMSITFITPPTPENGAEITVDYVNVTVSIAQTDISTVLLNWNGLNDTMHTLGINIWSVNKTNLPNEIYSYRVYANDTDGNTGMSTTRVVTVNVTVTGFDPWIYDENGNEKIDKDEVIAAIADYFEGKITKDQLVEVITLYFI